MIYLYSNLAQVCSGQLTYRLLGLLELMVGTETGNICKGTDSNSLPRKCVCSQSNQHGVY